MGEVILRLEGIKKYFGGVKAVDGVDFEIRKGRIHYLAGENGSGKSTLIKVISGVHTPTAGRMWIREEEVKNLSPLDILKEGIQVIYQDFAVFPNLSVAENISINRFLGEKGQLIDWKETEKIATEAMEIIGVNLPTDALMEDLSVADKQIVAICRALINDVDVLILDEPTTALTAEEVKKLNDVLITLKNQGIAIVIVNHKMDEVFTMADEVTILRNGKSVAAGPIENFDEKSFIKHLIGRDLTGEVYKVEKSGEEIFSVENLSSEGYFEDVSFSLNKGDVLAITGLLSSGRGRIGDALFGLIPITSGKVFLYGEELKINNTTDAIKNRIAYVPEDRLTQGLFMTRALVDNTVSASLKRYYEKGRMNHSRMAESTQKWIKALETKTHSPYALANELSGGNAQKVVIGKWLNTMPEVLILNGPTVGVDVGSKEEIHKILHELAADGVGVIIISDDLTEIVHNANKVVVIWEGKVAHEILADQVDEAQLLELISVDPNEVEMEKGETTYE